jgi:uncharacterized linocin/CFP29 family protein
MDPENQAAGSDIITYGAGGPVNGVGGVAGRLLANNLNIMSLRTNDVLRRDEWLLYDRTIVEVSRSRLIGVADLLNAGLRMDLANPFGTTVVQWDKSGDMTPANVNMSAVTEGERDRLEFTQGNLPVPITHKDFQLNIRTLEASRRGGQGLDVTTAAVATRKVNDALESMLFLGVNISVGGGAIYGYTTFPSRNTGSVTASWATATGDQILTDILAMLTAMQGDNFFGPFVIYVPVGVYIHLLSDFKAATQGSILDRVSGIPAIQAIRPTTLLTGTNIVMVQLTRDVVDMVVGFEPMPIMWETHGGMMINFKVLAIMVPRLKADSAGNSGIAHYS